MAIKVPFTNIVLGRQAPAATEEVRSVSSKSFLDWYFGTGGNGPSVNEKAVSGLAAWSRGRDIYSNAIAGLPKMLFRLNENGDQERVLNHPSLKLIRQMASPNLDSYSFHDYIMGSVVNHGNGYAIIIRNGNSTPTELVIVHPDRVTIKLVKNVLFYYIRVDDQQTLVLGYNDVYHIKGKTFNGYEGVNPIDLHRQTLGTELSAQQYNKDFYDNNTNLEGYLTTPGKLKPEDLMKLRESWFKTYAGGNKGKTAVLDNEMEYKQLGMKPEDAQYLQTRKFNKNEIATIMGLPAHMINEMDRATFNNIEHQAIEFVKYSLMPYVQKFEIQNQKLLTEAEKDNLFWKYNVNGLMRADSKARAEMYKVMHQISAMTPNQIRRLEDMNGYEGGDTYYAQLNMVPTDLQKEYLMKKGNGTASK